MNDGWKLVHHQCAQLLFNLILQVISHERYRVERRRNLERFERVIPEDKRQTLLPRENDNNEGRELELGKSDLQGDGQAGRCGEWLRRCKRGLGKQRSV